MEKHEYNISARLNGNNLQPLAGAEVRVTSLATGLPASLYQDDELTPIPQPLITDNNGFYSFKAADGKYALTYSPGANSSRFDPITREILLEDPADNPFMTKQELALSNGAATVGFGSRTVADRFDEIVSIKDAPFNARGDGVTDDTEAIQAAIDYVRTKRGAALRLPAEQAGQFYKITAPLTCDGPITIIGDGPHVVTLLAVGMTAGQYILNFNLPPTSNYFFNISGFTLRSDNAQPNGTRMVNTSYVKLDNVQLYNLVDGVTYAGTNCFSNCMDGVVGYQITRNTVRFDGFNGGGHFSFKNCTLTGADGLFVSSDSAINNLSISDTNFEQCGTSSLTISGSVEGFSLTGGRTEGSNANDFVINPTTGNSVTGISITGCYFTSDTAASRPIQLGGAGGKVRGFNICGNHASVTEAALVTLNGEGESGVISGNYLASPLATPANVQRAGVAVFGNENGGGKCAESWGMADWGVSEGTFIPTDASGAGIAFAAASGRYTKIGRVVHWQAYILFPATANAAPTDVEGLPFPVSLSTNAMGRAGAHVDLSSVGSAVGVMQGYSSATRFSFWNPTMLTQITNATLSGKELYVSGSYVTE